MKKTPYDRICIVLNQHPSEVEGHIKNLFLVINEELHLVNSGNSMHAVSQLNFLYNLSTNPYKAYEISKKMKSLIEGWGRIEILRNEEKEFFLELMLDCVVHNFKNDSAALFYVEQLIMEISGMIEDDSQFSGV